MVKEVRWPLRVQKQLEKVYQYISIDSGQNAEKVKKDILLSTSKLAASSDIYPLDKYRKIMMEVFGPMNCITTESLTGLL